MYMYPLGEIHGVVFKHLKLPDSRSNQMTTLKRSYWLSVSQSPLFEHQENRNEAGFPGELRD